MRKTGSLAGLWYFLWIIAKRNDTVNRICAYTCVFGCVKHRELFMHSAVQESTREILMYIAFLEVVYIING